MTELLISELLWLNFSGQDKPVYLYVNSVGSQTSDGQVCFQLWMLRCACLLCFVKLRGPQVPF